MVVRPHLCHLPAMCFLFCLLPCSSSVIQSQVIWWWRLDDVFPQKTDVQSRRQGVNSRRSCAVRWFIPELIGSLAKMMGAMDHNLTPSRGRKGDPSTLSIDHLCFYRCRGPIYLGILFRVHIFSCQFFQASDCPVVGSYKDERSSEIFAVFLWVKITAVGLRNQALDGE